VVARRRALVLRASVLLVLVATSTASAQDEEADGATPSAEARPSDASAAEVTRTPGRGIAARLRETADEFGPTLHWGETWGHAGALDYSVIGVSIAATTTFQILGPLAPDDPWVATTATDRSVRDRLGSHDEEQRGRMQDASDLLLSLVVSFPFLFDGLVTALWYHRSPEAGRELALLALETQFVTATLQSFANMVTSRQRPFVRRCGSEELPFDNGDCSGQMQYRSFFSGHTSQSFAAAATTCVFHGRLPLYGGGAPDALACAGALAVATTVGVLRITADMHYLSDVIAGALAGTAIGTLVPLLRMRGPRRRVAVVPNGLGLSVLGELR